MQPGERGQRFGAAQRGQLVHEQPYAYPAPRRGDQLVEHQPAGVVLVEDVGLHVQAGGRAADQVDPGHQRVGALVQDQCAVPWHGGGGSGQHLRGHPAQRRGRGAGILAVAVHVGVARGRGDPGAALQLLRRQCRAPGEAQQQQRQQAHHPGPHHGMGSSHRRRSKWTLPVSATRIASIP